MQRSVMFGSSKTTYRLSCAAMAVFGLTLAGCGNDGAVGDNSLGEWEQSALGTNALGTNALGTNALGTNALGTNALGTNALGTNALGTNGLNWLHETSGYNADRAQLLKYLAKCALGPTQYIPAHAAHSGCVGFPDYYGMYGLATNWPTQGMTDIYEQRWVTACVLAHVNQKGTPQTISLHGVHPVFASVTAERATMYASEGRYWGNIFRTELWKNVCAMNGRFGGADSPHYSDIILGRSCADDGCSAMIQNGVCPATGNSPSGINNWYNYDYQYQMTGYKTYGYMYQPGASGIPSTNSNYYFPTVEALGPVTLEFEGSNFLGVNGTLGKYPNGCFPDAAYNDGYRSTAISDTSLGSSAISPYISNCVSAAPCAGGDSTNAPDGQKLRGLPSGTRLRYSFLTSQPVGSNQFIIKMRYSAVGSAIKARLRINGAPFGGSYGTYVFRDTGSWDTYSTASIYTTFGTAPAALQNSGCPGYDDFANGKGTNMPYAVTLEVELEPGATFPDLDSVRLEPVN